MKTLNSIVISLITLWLVGCANFTEGTFRQPPRKALVMAWDGTVPSFALVMVREGKLPNLAKLLAEAAWADDVMPVFPSKTAPGFAALMTGAPPRLTGITGNRVPRMPRGQHTILESDGGFAGAPLKAEAVWQAAARSGKKVIVSHIPAFGAEGSEDSVRINGYGLRAGRDGTITAQSAKPIPAAAWANLPASDTPPMEITFSIGSSRLYGLIFGDPSNHSSGYDAMMVATERDGARALAQLSAPAPTTERFSHWSPPLPVMVRGDQHAMTCLRLFYLKSDGSEFLLYYTRPTRSIAAQAKEFQQASPLIRTFIGNGASILYPQGGLGKTIPDGGDGIAEARYVETIAFAQQQLIETNRWAMTHLPWDLFLAYSPFPDEGEHMWRGYLDPALSTIRADIAQRLRPYLEQVYRSSDTHLGRLLAQRPVNSLVALISDHGLEGFNRRVAVNVALENAGLLTLDSQGKIDLSKTKVIYSAVNSGFLIVNSTDRKDGIVPSEEIDRVIDASRTVLMNLRDGDRKIVTAVFDARRDGEAMGIGGDAGGDLYIELAYGYEFDPRINPSSLISEIEPHGTHGANPAQPSVRTLMVWHGPGIRAGAKLKNSRIVDFAPTLADWLGIDRPKDATGRVLSEALLPTH